MPTPYHPAATCPRWERFLDEIFDGDGERISFLQRGVGYSLTGSTEEQLLFFAFGTGQNGKTVMFETLHRVLGPDYAQATPFNTLLTQHHHDGPRNDLARLRGARFVSASEAPGGRALDAAVLKQLVGSDTVVARFLHQEFFEYRPEFKLWLRANHVREQARLDRALGPERGPQRRGDDGDVGGPRIFGGWVFREHLMRARQLKRVLGGIRP